jgi:hypothetical protein
MVISVGFTGGGTGGVGGGTGLLSLPHAANDNGITAPAATPTLLTVPIVFTSFIFFIFIP